MKSEYPFLFALLVLFMAGCSPQTSADGKPADSIAAADTSGTCTPLETKARETKYEPAFEGQTRACGVNSGVDFDIDVVTDALQSPWAVEPLSGGDFLVTEKPGRVRIVSATGVISAPISGVPEVDDDGQGGLLDVALSPNFATDRTIFWSFTEPRNDGNGTSVARGVLSTDRSRLENVQVIFQARPSYGNDLHFGSRLTFDAEGMLLVTLGERSDRATRPQAQQLNSHLGKIVRIQPDGKPAPGNPFIGRSDARPEIWSYGHRNVQAAAFDAQGRFWEIEHGPRGGDELNLVEKGKNYGWPIITYGIEYSGEEMTGSARTRAGMEQPVYYWDPVIAPAGLQFYTGNAFPEWKNSLFVGALRQMRLVRLVIENNRVTGEEHLLADRQQRVRDVRQGPDGFLYVVTDSGQLLRIKPAT